MTEQRERMERALRGCAEAGVSDSVDLWPGIREQVAAEPRRRSRRFVPGTRAGWAAALLTMLMLSTAGFAANGWVDELFTDTAPAIGEASYAVPLNEKKTIDGVTFTLNKAYADENNLVVGYSVSGFGRGKTDNLVSGHTVVTDGGTRDFEYVGGLGMGTDPAFGPEKKQKFSDLAFFEPTEKMAPSGRHHFRFNLELNPNIAGKNRRDAATGGSAKEVLTFDFNIPVRKLDTIEVGETVEANGIPMTLDRVENSPARAQALLCFDPPQDEKYNWVPVIERPNIAESDVFVDEQLYDSKPEETVGCLGASLFRSVYDEPGRHSFTVTEIYGWSPGKMNPDKTITGPWRFTFEVPRAGE